MSNTIAVRHQKVSNRIKKVPLKFIRTDEEQFQVRNLNANPINVACNRQEQEDELITDLVKAIENTGKLDPIIVLKEDEFNYVVVDGHHRFHAYTKTTRKDKRIAVQEFNGTVEEARLFAHQTNSRNQLGMTAKERSESAWKHIFHYYDMYRQMSNPELGRILNVSKETIRKMKRNASEIRKAMASNPEMNLPMWTEIVSRDFEDTSTPEKHVKKLKALLEKYFQDDKENEPELFAQAIQEFLGDDFPMELTMKEGCSFPVYDDEF